MKIMEYMVFVIYVIVVAQFIDSSVENTERTQKGRTFYKYSAISNMVIGFILQVVYAMYCLYKVGVSNEP